jgi:hypothetical protein
LTPLRLEIAGVRVELRVPDAEPPELSRFRPFEKDSGAIDWTLDLGPGRLEAAVPPGLTLHERDGAWRTDVPEGAWLDPGSGRGAAPLDPGVLLLDTLVRAAVSWSVLAAGGLLLHGAAVVVDGRAHLFPARSGSGKSTLAARARYPLSDEVSILLPGRAGFEVHATPWWTSRGGTAQLACVYALAWGSEGVEPLRGTALRQLATNLVLPLDGPGTRRRALAAAARVAATVPFARLAFRPDSDVDQLLRAASPDGHVG